MTPRGIAATKGIKATTDYIHLRQGYGGQARLHRWGKVWDGELRMNLNSGTHEQICQPVSRQDAKAQRGRERRGNVAGKQENQENRKKAGLTTEGHRGAQRGRGKEGGEREAIFNKESSMFKVLAKMAYGNGRMRNEF